MIGNEAKISYLPSGKPLLEQSIYKNISITHSRDFVAIILSMNRKVGIDIEDTTRDFERIRQRYLSLDESQFTGNNQQLQCLFWCIKEAVFKLVGVEGVEFREQIRITPDEIEQNRFFTTFIDGDKRTTYPVNFEFFEESCLAWVVE
jgi:phosphopantetheinyl transferase